MAIALLSLPPDKFRNVMFFDFLRRRRLKRTLERFVARDIAQVILSGEYKLPPEGLFVCEERNLEVALIAVGAPDVHTYNDRIGEIIGFANKLEGNVTSLSPVMVVAFGDFGVANPSARGLFVKEVMARFPECAAIVHGSILTQVGEFGNPERREYGFWWPGKLDAFRLLSTLAPGQVVELPAQK